MTEDIKVIVAAHKPYWMPEDGIYLPLHVGAAISAPEGGSPLGPDFTRDDAGENISEKNREYCELTGLYWAWKNLDAEYIGLTHYRRHFTLHRSALGRDKKTMPARGRELRPLLQKHGVILPVKRHYVIETNWSQYAHAHYERDLKLARDVICRLCPEYTDAFDQCMRRTWGHRFNMLIMRRDILDAYCSWLFTVLRALEDRIDLSGYSENDRRVFGFLGERLLDVWIEKQGVEYAELPHVFMERQNWPVKIARFLRRKAAGGEGRKKDEK